MQQKEEASGLVLENRVSWSTYNKLRKAEGLATSRKRPVENGANGEPSSKRRYGNISTTLQIDTQRVLTEAQAWSPDEQINWSQLAREYGITSPNSRQLIKEFLRENNIPTAKIKQTPSRAMCRCKRKVSAGSSITLPRKIPLRKIRENLLKKHE